MKITKSNIEIVLQNFKASRNAVQYEMNTGFEFLDEIIGGLHKGQMIVIAGHRHIGKTCFSMSLIENICHRQNTPLAIFSMKHTKEQFLERLLFNYSQIDSFKARRYGLTNSENERISQTSDLLTKMSLYIDDTARLTTLELRNKVEQILEEHGHAIECVIINNLQMLDTEVYQANARIRVLEISKSLKALACDLNISVVVLCDLQDKLKYESESRREPEISDLGVYAIIERFSDTILMLYRENYYYWSDLDYEPNNNAKVIIARNNSGPTGAVALQFISGTSRFEEINFKVR